jgi:L-iditol 2-dehydrogenase
MKTAIMTELGKLAFIDEPTPEPKDDEVLVKVGYVGICGSDLHYFESGRIGNFVVEFPFVLGHEVAGTVEKVGRDVRGLLPGDRVALEPNVSCGVCEYCRSGLYNLCPDVVFFATPPVGGTFREYVTHPARLSFRLPDNVSTMEGALIEPLSVGVHAAAIGEAMPGQSAVVTGSGCIGLSSLLALRAEGVEDVTVVDMERKRLEKAMELGAKHVVNAADEADMVAKLRGLTGDRGFDLAVETSGTEAATRQAILSVRKGGVVVVVGYSPGGEMTIPLNHMIDNEISMKTVFRYRDTYPKAIQAVSDGMIDLKAIATNVFAFDDLQTAMEQSIKDKANIVKSVVKIG